jgi:hypothetical protein
MFRLLRGKNDRTRCRANVDMLSHVVIAHSFLSFLFLSHVAPRCEKPRAEAQLKSEDYFSRSLVLEDTTPSGAISSGSGEPTLLSTRIEATRQALPPTAYGVSHKSNSRSDRVREVSHSILNL